MLVDHDVWSITWDIRYFADRTLGTISIQLCLIFLMGIYICSNHETRCAHSWFSIMPCRLLLPSGLLLLNCRNKERTLPYVTLTGILVQSKDDKVAAAYASRQAWAKNLNFAVVGRANPRTQTKTFVCTDLKNNTIYKVYLSHMMTQRQKFLTHFLPS